MTVKITEPENTALHGPYTRYNSYAALLFENETQYLEKYLQAYVDFSMVQSKVCRDYNLPNMVMMNFTEHEVTSTGVNEKRTYLDAPTGDMPTIHLRLAACEFLVNNYKETDKISFQQIILWLAQERAKYEAEYARLGIDGAYYDGIQDKFFTKE